MATVSETNRGRLADHTTLRLGGPTDSLVEATDRDRIVAAVTGADAVGEPVLLVAGGSNLVVSDEGFRGVTVLLRSRGVTVTDDADHVEVTVAAGENWDALVARSCAEGWSGLEFLSGIPGSAGATPIQNVGAYGQEISSVFRHTDVLDRHSGEIRRFTGPECHFGYRDSVFKHARDRYVVLEVTYRLAKSPLSQPIRYPETAAALDVAVGETVPLAVARQTVLTLRRGKGMVLDPSDPDTYSAGSFFINPVVDTARFDAVAAAATTTPPHWRVDGGVKLSAAWLIGQAGFRRGYGHDGVAISGKHLLALTNRGEGSSKALLSLAREIRDRVEERFGVRLRPEPTMVGIDW
ncbi:UDP-N-acetylmuramate dehydrogenase [Stackebrandtia albiflava]|uniref:UDP-N-acetylmuramate dehydrogenase n=1 Tax=Stackebrandtia albiflava TaxID=406432 RepID=UPI0011BEBFE5